MDFDNFISNALSSRDNGTNNIGVEKVYNSDKIRNNSAISMSLPVYTKI